MGLLGNAIAKGISKAVSSAVEEGVKKVAAPKIQEAATNASNKVAAKVDEFAGEAASSLSQSAEELRQAAGETQAAAVNAGETIKEQTGASNLGEGLNALGSIFGSYANAAMGYANSVAANAKICPKCGAVVMDASKVFCPECGAKLPETTMGQDAICPECGFQNDVDTKFCAKCGAKLPNVLAEEKRFAEEWNEKLPVYPVWNICGTNYEINTYDQSTNFSATGVDKKDLAKYVEVLKANGFVQAIEGTDDILYKTVEGKNYAVDIDNAFETESLCLRFFFYTPKQETKKEEKGKLGSIDGLIDKKSKDIKEGVESAKEAAKNVINFFKK